MWCIKGIDWMANCIDPDQPAGWSGSTLFDQEYIGISRGTIVF